MIYDVWCKFTVLVLCQVDTCYMPVFANLHLLSFMATNVNQFLPKRAIFVRSALNQLSSAKRSFLLLYLLPKLLNLLPEPPLVCGCSSVRKACFQNRCRCAFLPDDKYSVSWALMSRAGFFEIISSKYGAALQKTVEIDSRDRFAVERVSVRIN